MSRPGLCRPVLGSRREYARKFNDVAFWEPYVHEVMRRDGLAASAVAIGTGGTFQTFLVGAYVVKFFPRRFDGGECFLIERSVHTNVLDHVDIPAPRHVAHGHLFQTGWQWPHVVTTRLDGTPWRHAHIPDPSQKALASQLGTLLRRVHELGCSDEPVWQCDLIGELRATCADRHRRRGMLPTRLVDQIDRYLAAPSPVRCLVHGDHVFVNDARLVEVIDWGDAACQRALAIHGASYTSVHSILKNRLDQVPAVVDPPANIVPLLHPNLRGTAYYQQALLEA